MTGAYLQNIGRSHPTRDFTIGYRGMVRSKHPVIAAYYCRFWLPHKCLIPLSRQNRCLAIPI
jgi:hypothetical protein